MKKVSMYPHEQMLFALLRASLHEQATDTSLFEDCHAEMWKQCHALAVRQGVMALAWDGVMRLPADLQPPLSLKLSWAAAVERYEQKYRCYCHTVDELSRFYAKHGITTMQMKGVGLSAIYPVPSHREGGDIDIYTYSADKGKMSDKEANRLADDLMEQLNIEVHNDHGPKHSVFFYKGIPIENHKTFLNVESYRVAVQADEVLKACMNPQTTVLDGGRVLTPSPQFNMLFVSFHAAQHYGSGLALHHLCDWACLLKTYGLQMPEGINDRSFLRFVSALTLLSNRLLGTDITTSNAAKDLAHKIQEEMFHPRYQADVPAKTKLGILVYKTRRMLYSASLKREVLGISICKVICRSIVEHLRKPELIFR